MKFFKTMISSFKHTKLLIVIFFILTILLNYLTTYIPVVIQYFIDTILNEEATQNEILDWVVNSFQNGIGFIATICLTVLVIQYV